MKQIILVIISLLCTVGTIAAQKVISKVHLKDGTILEGEIVEDTDYLIKLKVGTGDVIDVGYKLIDYIGDKPLSSTKEKHPIYTHDRGMIYDLAITQYLSHDRSPGFEGMIGRVLSDRHQVGLLTRYRKDRYNLQIWSGNQSYIDIGPYYRHFISSPQKFRWYAEASAGVTMLVEEDVSLAVDNDVHPHANISLGIRIGSSRRTGLTVKTGISYNKVSFSTFANENNRDFSVSVDYSKAYFTPHITAGLNF